MCDQLELTNEKRKAEKLVVSSMRDVVGKGFPGHSQSMFNQLT